jgi:rhodanese-related sulfurtransferase
LTTSSKLQLLAATQLVEEQRAGALLLDVRDPEQFVSFHIRGAIQVGLTGPFASWAAILIAPAQRLVLVAEDARHVHEAHTRLIRVGLGHVIGYSLADEIQWRSEGMDVVSISTRRCAAALKILINDPSIQLVDVRSQAEWLRGHLPGAVSFPLLNLASEAPSVDRSRPILVYCTDVYRAAAAASILLRKSSGDIGILIDGVKGWSELGLPLEMPDADPSGRSSIPLAPNEPSFN